MAPSSVQGKLRAANNKFAVLLCTALNIISSGLAAGDVVSYSFPAFNATTTDNLVVVTNSSIVTPASLLFDPGLFVNTTTDFNASEGFLLLPSTIDFWRPADDLEASFSTSFTVAAGAAPVSFVVLKNRFPTFKPFNQPSGLRGAANYSRSAGGPVRTNATAGSLAFVEVDAVRSYGPDVPTASLNVTVTPRVGAALAVWVEYRAADVHRLSVYVAGAGEARPVKALVNTSLGVDGHWTTETASVGFFAATIRDIFVGVRDWNLTADRFPVSAGVTANGKKGMSWLLLAVLGSMAATSTF
jgi:hypothetical protein